MSQYKIIINASNIHTGGGKVLVNDLLIHLGNYISSTTLNMNLGDRIHGQKSKICEIWSTRSNFSFFHICHI